MLTTGLHEAASGGTRGTVDEPAGGTRTTRAWDRRIGRGPGRAVALAAVRHFAQPSRPQLAAAVVGTLALAWLLAFLGGDAIAVARHWFYVPVVVAAVGFGVLGGVSTAVVAAVLAGPFAASAPLGVWATRGVFFLIIGALVGVLTEGLRAAVDREAEVAAREADLVGQRNALIQTVSHEFRTPLTVINGVAQTLARRQLDPSERRRLVESLGRAALRLNEMLSVILAAAEATDVRTSLDQVHVGLADIVREATAGLTGARGRVSFTVASPGVSLVTVPALVQLIVRCLVDNALKFSPEDRGVDIVVRRTPSDVLIEVRDRGLGIDPSRLDRVFDAFTQGDASERRAHGGLGMGLYAARELATKLGGDLRLTPRSGGGTVATVRIPQRRTEDDEGRPRVGHDADRSPPLPPA